MPFWDCMLKHSFVNDRSPFFFVFFALCLPAIRVGAPATETLSGGGGGAENKSRA